MPGALRDLGVRPAPHVGPILFVCTRNSARSQFAAALWRRTHGTDAESAGTEPAEHVHVGAISAARRAGLDLDDAFPRRLERATPPELIVTVCDRAHEELRFATRHWSIPDPVVDGSDAAFDRALELIRARITALTPRTTA